MVKSVFILYGSNHRDDVIPVHMEEVSHEILQDISVSEKLLRVKRSSNSNNEDNCFDELFNKGKLPNNCGK